MRKYRNNFHALKKILLHQQNVDRKKEIVNTKKRERRKKLNYKSRLLVLTNCPQKWSNCAISLIISRDDLLVKASWWVCWHFDCVIFFYATYKKDLRVQKKKNFVISFN
jgi:hypothetical protein